MIRIVCLRKDGSLERDDQPNSPLLKFSPDDTIWVDLFNPGSEEQAILNEVFRFHPLAVEDALVELLYPKIDEYPDYLYIVVHGVNYRESEGKFVTAELDSFLGRRFLVTYHDHEMRSVNSAYQRVCEEPRLLERPDRLLHTVLDRMVDNYFPELEKLEDRIEQLEHATFEHPDQKVLNEIFRLKRDVAHLKRIVYPQREVFNRLSRDENAFIHADARLYFRDIYDNLFRMTDIADSYRDLLTGVLDAYLSSISNNLNQVMKVLTVITTVFVPFTAVSGILGMNFEKIPGASHPLGFFTAIGLMCAFSAVMLFFFRRNKWF